MPALIPFTALFLDAVLIGFITGILHHAFNLQLLLLASYGAVMWKLKGATLGGIIFDLQVVRLEGRAMNWETAIIRALGCRHGRRAGSEDRAQSPAVMIRIG